jgi:hypothetical protein
MTVPVVLAIAGAIGLFLGILGGGIKAKEVEIPAVSNRSRYLVGFLGLVLIGMAIWLSTVNSVPTTEYTVATKVIITATSIPPLPTPTAINIIEATISRSKVNGWSLGETTEVNVNKCLDEHGKVLAPFIYFKKGDTIPKGVLLATSFWVDGGNHWNQFPVKPICVYNDWGLFESTDAFQATSSGDYLRIVP